MTEMNVSESFAKEKMMNESVSEAKPSEAVLKIYDPAMCCSSGVCGPSVDPALARFAGALKFVAGQPNIRVERYNLGQQPRAFVENAQVKSMLGNGGEKRPPRTHCKKCGQPTCTVFSAQVMEGGRGADDCPELTAGNREKLKGYLSGFDFD